MTNLLTRWKEGLAKTSQAAFGQIATLLGATEISPDTWEELESLLIQADIGMDTTDIILDHLERRVDNEGMIKSTQLYTALRQELRSLLENPPVLAFSEKPSIILIVGVNGSGKTTTIAKLGKRFADQGKRVLVVAADTYRAAAIDQLEIWADRLNLPIISGQPGSDPGAIAYDAVQSAISRNIDIVLIDTAGRLHTRFNLMEELKKVHRVVRKSMSNAPHHVWLVMDATTGQNALRQAQAFKEAVGVSGIILAKLDSSSRGGMVFSIQRELRLPILYAGLGEKPQDLQIFDAEAFVEGILNTPEPQ
jgi:fused signal recognition particle receptor